MDHETLRLKCLELARAEGMAGGDLLKRAQELFDFLRFGQDSATEARRMLAAQAIETPMATIYKRPPFLGDYKPE